MGTMRKKPQAEEPPWAGMSPVRAEAERHRRSEFMVACASGYLDRVKEMLSEGVDPNCVNDQGDTPLSWAVAWERYKVTECLLSHGAEVELPERPNWSPLMHAASRGNEAIVSLLMAYGANALRRNKFGQLPMDVAKKNGRLDCALLIERLSRTARDPNHCCGAPRFWQRPLAVGQRKY